MKPSKAVIAGAAIAGLRAGSSAVRTYGAGVSLQTTGDTRKTKNSCNHCGSSARYSFTDYREQPRPKTRRVRFRGTEFSKLRSSVYPSLFKIFIDRQRGFTGPPDAKNRAFRHRDLWTYGQWKPVRRSVRHKKGINTDAAVLTTYTYLREAVRSFHD